MTHSGKKGLPLSFFFRALRALPASIPAAAPLGLGHPDHSLPYTSPDRLGSARQDHPRPGRRRQSSRRRLLRLIVPPPVPALPTVMLDLVPPVIPQQLSCRLCRTHFRVDMDIKDSVTQRVS